jgi:TRAP-type C4-dicarboxylate transport system substrate-binding protein
LAVAIIGIATTLPACTPDESVQWRFALEHGEYSVQHGYAQRFAQLVEERSEGRIRVAIYPAPMLGSPADLVYLAQSGSIQFTFASIGTLGGLIPEAQALLLHDTFSRHDEINHQLIVQPDAWQDELAEAYLARGLALVGLLNQGWMIWTADRSLRDIADFRGLRVRTMPAPLLRAEYDHYGARSTPISEQELYGALELNIVDAQVGTLAMVEHLGLDAHQSYLIRPKLAGAVTSLIAKPAFLDGLAPEDRRLVLDVVAELADEAYWLQREVDEANLAKIRARSEIVVIDLEDAQREVFSAAARDVRDAFLESADDRVARIATRLTERRAELERQTPEFASTSTKRPERRMRHTTRQ